jgi:hypothetical protein
MPFWSPSLRSGSRTLRIACFLAIALGAAAPALAEGDKDDKVKLLVLDFTSQDDRIRASALSTMSGLAAAHLSGVSRLEVISSAEVKSIVELEGEKQALGCEEDTSCLAEVASAMGARLIVMGQMNKLGSLFVLNVSLFDSDEAKTVSRRSVKANNLDQLAVALDPALDQMAGEFFGETIQANVTTTTATESGSSSSGATTVGGATTTSGDAAVKSADGVRVGLASAAGGLGAGLGYAVGMFLGLAPQLGADGPFIWPGEDFGDMLQNGAYAGGFTYLGTVVGAAYFNDAVGANITGVVTGVATFIGVFGAWGTAAILDVEDTEGATYAAMGTGAVVAIGTAIALTPVFLVEPGEAVGGKIFSGR